MALQVTNITRKFVYDDGKTKIDLTDPNGELSPAEVIKFHSAKHAALTNAVIEGPIIIKGNAIYTATTKAGKLG